MSFLPRFSAHIGNLFTELPFAERIAAAARHGFSAVEYPDPYEHPAEQVARWLADSGLGYVQLGVIGDTTRGDKGLAALPGRETEFRECLSRALDYAAIVKARYVHVLAGIVPTGEDRDGAWPRYLDNLAMAVEEGAARGQAMLVEAMSPRGAPGYFLDDPKLALEAIHAVGRPDLGLMVDIFHSANAAVDPAELIRRAGSKVVHVHLADHPGRHEPGTGRVDFGAVWAALDEIGYEGLLGCEYLPAGATNAGLGWMDRPPWPTGRTE